MPLLITRIRQLSPVVTTVCQDYQLSTINITSLLVDCQLAVRILVCRRVAGVGVRCLVLVR